MASYSISGRSIGSTSDRVGLEGTPETEPDSSEFDLFAEWDNLGLPPVNGDTSEWDHVWENGRRYHMYEQGRYPLPNDEQEQNRDDLKHEIMLELTDGKLHLAPLRHTVEKIIDMGTGNGLWAIEVGDRYPNCQVLGIDLSPIQPEHIPPNVRFLVDDCEADWENGNNWDYAHFRQMTPTLVDVPRVLQQTFANLKPGGWIEFQEFYAVPRCDDGTMKDDDPCARFATLINDALELRGMSLEKCRALRGPMTRAGFRNIRLIKKKIPIGEWESTPKLRRVGLLQKLSFIDVITAITGKMFEDLGISRLEREVWSATVRRSLDDLTIHRYFTLYFWVAQKPAAPPPAAPPPAAPAAAAPAATAAPAAALAAAPAATAAPAPAAPAPAPTAAI